MGMPAMEGDRSAPAASVHARSEAGRHDRVGAALLENPDLWLMVADADGSIRLWNRGAERISGYPGDEVLGHADTWRRLFPDERYRHQVRGRCLGASAVAEQRDIEVAIRCLDGHTKILVWHLGPPGKGSEGGCLALGRELTDRAYTIHVLEHPEARFERFLSSLNVGVFRARTRSPGRGITANPALARMLGFDSTAELLGFGLERLIEPAEHRRLLELLAQHREWHDVEAQLLRRDGAPVDVAVNALAEYDEQGDLVLLTGTIEDIHERKAAQQALKASEEKYRQLAEGVGEPIFTVDEYGVCLAMNRVAAQYAGGEPEDFEGKMLYDVFPASMANVFMVATHEVIDTDRPSSCEFQALLPGNPRWFQLRLHPLRGVDGEAAKVQILALDVTSKKEAEQELMRYQERLRALAARLSDAEERERRRLAADLHDGVSQSLALAIMKLGVLGSAASRRREAEELRDILGLAEQALHATRTLTSELSPPVLAEFGFAEALEWLAERTTGRYGLPVRVECRGLAPDLPEHAQTVLFRAVRELLVNVGRHAQAQEAVVTAWLAGHNVFVSVCDDGRGIGDALDAPPVGKAGGFGLFNVREQLGRLGGRMEVSSSPGNGTRVLLIMPVDAGGADPQGEPA
jgi:PAS domain S-box-containing protein